MNRRQAITTLAWAGLLPLALRTKTFARIWQDEKMLRTDFGVDFKWGVATAAYQIEGAWQADGKGPSVWDHFTEHKAHRIHQKQNGNVACDFYNRYADDLKLVKDMNFEVFRFSLAWSRIFPLGTGAVNQAGVDFYHKVIDACFALGLEPWITLYHWDLPQALEEQGGWTNRKIVSWFAAYTDFCTKEYGGKVKNWLILNEPMAFTAVGYMLGIHAPGRRSLHAFYAAAHHATLCQAEGGRIVKANVSGANVGTTFSCSYMSPYRDNGKDDQAVKRADAMINRLFIEPAMGLGYPSEAIDFPEKMAKYIQPGDMDKATFKFDFIGLQNYTRQVTKRGVLIPVLGAKEIKAQKRKAPHTEMGWEVYPEGIYHLLKKFASYTDVPILVTENGAAFADKVENGQVNDPRRVQYFKDYLAQVLRAKRDGVDVQGYFVWTFMDNFEWAEGYRTRFGLVYTDFETQERIVKNSGLWFKAFLQR